MLQLKQMGKSNYDILMRETSDIMQQVAMAYGERSCLEYCMSTLNQVTNKVNKWLLTMVFKLFAADIVDRELPFFILSGVVNSKASKDLTQQRHSLIKILASKSDDLLDCLNIPKHALYAPIANDYVKYNATPNFGEVIGAKM